MRLIRLRGCCYGDEMYVSFFVGIFLADRMRVDPIAFFVFFVFFSIRRVVHSDSQRGFRRKQRHSPSSIWKWTTTYFAFKDLSLFLCLFSIYLSICLSVYLSVC